MNVTEVLKAITDNNLDYGSVWSEERLVEVFSIDLPDLSGNAQSIIKNAKKFELAKVNAYLMVNEQLLNHGMCFIQDKDNYRVPLISEMTSCIDKYYNSSTRKFKRAEKLRRSFSGKYPVLAKEVNDKANKEHIIQLSQSKQYKPMA